MNTVLTMTTKYWRAQHGDNPITQPTNPAVYFTTLGMIPMPDYSIKRYTGTEHILYIHYITRLYI